MSAEAGVVGTLGGATADERELAVRTARKDGKQVASLRAVERGGGCVVECEVYPVGGIAIDPLTPGPYTFAEASEATRFIDEALQALMDLGCDVA